jgi:hypothetical protein
MKKKQSKKWDEYIALAWDDMARECIKREIGKMLAIPNEFFQKDWINENTELKVLRREEMEDDGDKNQSGYDLLSRNSLRIQAKFRSSTIHLENTRRHSKKNQGAASQSGHVAYRVEETDVYCFSRPEEGCYINTDDTEILAIPARDLEDPKNPGFIRRSVPKSIVNKYKGRAIEILESMEKEWALNAG